MINLQLSPADSTSYSLVTCGAFIACTELDQAVVLTQVQLYYELYLFSMIVSS
jgi:hypothetical protein